MAQVVISIDDPAWSELDIAEEVREVANRIEEGYNHGITGFGNCWSIEEL